MISSVIRIRIQKTLLLVVGLLLIFSLCSCGTITTAESSAYRDDTESVDTTDTPSPIDAENQEIDTTKEGTCILSVECSTILDHMESLTKTKTEIVPADGVIFGPTEVTFYQGESVFDVLQREMQANEIQMEFAWTPLYDSNYVEGIANLYEFDCGELSGWMFCVNDWYPNYGASRYLVSEGDVIEWHYTCDIGEDLGQDME